ncbi:MAG: MFS transporter, partial [Deltaproteobacteria bacterium]|nr:MFS transporter [Deltaproteobacteria bacterium]
MPDSAADRRYANYVLAILFLVYVFNFIDRTILSILVEDVKRDLGVSDTAMGFLTGIAFALFYTIAGIPIARWADVGVRRSIIALGLLVWSLMTAASGLAQNYGQLVAARIGVGVGEAAGSPPAHSLIADYFPPERRATVLSL